MIMLWLVSDNVVITVYNVYVCISLVKLTFSFLFFRLFAAGFIIPVNKDHQFVFFRRPQFHAVVFFSFLRACHFRRLPADLLRRRNVSFSLSFRKKTLPACRPAVVYAACPAIRGDDRGTSERPCTLGVFLDSAALVRHTHCVVAMLPVAYTAT